MHHTIHPCSYDDDELADAAGRHACSLLEAGEMSPSHLVSLMWAYGLQVRHWQPFWSV
jgi:hypothetical protein